MMIFPVQSSKQLLTLCHNVVHKAHAEAEVDDIPQMGHLHKGDMFTAKNYAAFTFHRV